MNSLNKIWSKVEKPVIFITLFIFMLTQLIPLIFDACILSKYISQETTYALIALILFYLFLFIDRRIPRDGSLIGGIIPYSDLSSAISHILKKAGEIKTLDIFSHSSQTFYSHLNKKIKRDKPNIRVVVRNSDSKEFLTHLKEDKIKEREKSQIKNAIGIWKNLGPHHGIKDIKLFSYNFEPSFHLLIINKQYGLIGFFVPVQTGFGFSYDNVLVIDRGKIESCVFLDYLIEWFEKNIEDKFNSIS